MRIQTSMGRLPRNANMENRCWRVTLTADNQFEQEQLAALYHESRGGNIGYWLNKMVAAVKRDDKKRLQGKGVAK